MKMSINKSKKRVGRTVGRRRSYAAHWKAVTKRKILKQDKKAKRRVTVRKVLLGGALVFVLITLLGIIWVSAKVAELSRLIPEPGEPFATESMPQTTYIYDRTGNVELYKIYGDRNAEWIDLENIPSHVRGAFLAAEDAEFYSHKGLDIPGLTKGILHELLGLGSPRGGSTITQQLIQNATNIGRSPTYERKAKEMILALQIEQSYSKDEILESYLNHIPFGGNIYGIKAASKIYFGKEPSALTVAEAALLAGIPQRPNLFAPAPRGANPPYTAYQARSNVGYPNNPDSYLSEYVTQEDLIAQNITDPKEYLMPANKWRQLYVLDQILSKNNILANSVCNCAISSELVSEAKIEPLSYIKYVENKKAGHFVDYVRVELENMFKEQGGSTYVGTAGLKVYTTLDWDIQELAQSTVADIDNKKQIGASNAALIATDPNTGEIIAMVGSKNYNGEDEGCAPNGLCKFNGQTNVLTSLRSPGSSGKPFAYLAFFINGFAPTTIVPDIPIDFGGYKPKNYEGGFYGLRVDADYALSKSRNIPAIEALDAIGMDAYADVLSKMGYSDQTVERYRVAGLASPIGGASITMLEHAQAYSTLATGGIRHNLVSIIRIEDRDGKVIWEKPSDSGVRVIDEKYTYLVTDIIKDYWTLDAVKRKGYHVAGKTGTNDGPRDVVFAGYTRNFVAVIWGGNNDNTPLRGDATGSKIATQLWNNFAISALAKYPNEPFIRPSGVVSASVCADTGLSPGNSGCARKTGLFVEGQLPPEDTGRTKVLVAPCPDVLKLASPADIVAGVAYEATFVQLPSPSPRLQPQINDYIRTHSGSGYGVAPTETCSMYRGPADDLLVSFTSPPAGSTYSVGSSVYMEASVGTPNGIVSVKFYVDGNLIKTATQAPYSATLAIDSSFTAGTHTLRAEGLDTAGKTGSGVVTFSVQKDLPTIAVSGGPTIVKTGSISISSSNPSKITSLIVYARNASNPDDKGKPIYSGPMTSSFTWNTQTPPKIPDGSTYTVWAVAMAGVDPIKSSEIIITILVPDET